MQEITGDLFAHNENGPQAICITTNGFVNAGGANTMGRGCAGEAKIRWPGIQVLLGSHIQQFGNHVHRLTVASEGGEITIPKVMGWPARKTPYHIFSFPTKPDVVNDAQDLLPAYRHKYEGHEEDLGLPGWMAKSSLDLIYQSACELRDAVGKMDLESVVLPRPGCGAGELDWERVRDVLKALLDERFYCITFG